MKQYFQILLFLLIFSLTPFFSLFILATYIILERRDDKVCIYLFCLLCGIFLGCINSTKIPENDLLWYIRDYLIAGKMSLFRYWFSFGEGMGGGSGKELFFPTLNYIIYYITNGSVAGYLIIFTTICYSFLNIAVYKLCRYLNVGLFFTISAILITTFNPYIFTLSAQLMRQFLAASMLTYIIVKYVFYKEKVWLLMIAMVLTHTSSLFFLPLLLFPFFSKYLTKNIFFFYVTGTLLMYFLPVFSTKILSLMMGSNNMLTHALKKSTSDASLGELTWISMLVTILMAVVPLFLIYIYRPHLKGNSKIVHLSNIMLCIVCFVVSNYHPPYTTEVAIRFNFYIWLLFPLLFIIIYKNFRLNILFLAPIAIGLSLFFIYYLNHGTFRYLVTDNIWWYTFYNYIY